MYHDPRFALSVVQRSHQEHRMIAAEHRLARQSRAADEVPTRASASLAVDPAPRRWNVRWLTRLAGHPVVTSVDPGLPTA